MALGAVDKHNVNVHIVPCGLTYFSGHRFRGHVIAEFGRDLHPQPFSLFSNMLRKKANLLLSHRMMKE